MTATNSLDYQERGDVAMVTVHRLSRGLLLSDPDAMKETWTLLHRAATSRCKVLLLTFDSDALAAQRLDEAWEDIFQQSAGDRRTPPQIRALEHNIRNLIEYYQRSRMLTIAAFSGALDLDLFGLFAIAHYRICANDAVIQNNTLDRDAPPGAATVWFLSQMIGTAATRNVYLNEGLLTADDALNLNLVNDIVPAEQLQHFSEQKAEYFASKSRIAIRTLMIALNGTHLGLSDFLEAIGTGFETVFRETSADGR